MVSIQERFLIKSELYWCTYCSHFFLHILSIEWTSKMYKKVKNYFWLSKRYSSATIIVMQLNFPPISSWFWNLFWKLFYNPDPLPPPRFQQPCMSGPTLQTIKCSGYKKTRSSFTYALLPKDFSIHDSSFMLSHLILNAPNLLHNLSFVKPRYFV